MELGVFESHHLHTPKCKHSHIGFLWEQPENRVLSCRENPAREIGVTLLFQYNRWVGSHVQLVNHLNSSSHKGGIGLKTKVESIEDIIFNFHATLFSALEC